ncbi:ectonucleoside triphosphate diphosphohydrolase 3 [Trichonephila inaurata madagascariensis]|uniref:Ectonucleoside triphosphate diphosphohydrolase 3 n=1 Tax=Trichonephila inaurata madagascariensis TaxID=2747483 RepID=A0A8X6WLP1_9ARAC|nr:ectonucleoside triphosphate diphosphohydrolase 3 [Trichonephila inaurata madagascariensis]
MKKASQMQVILQPLSSSEGSSVLVETNPQATVASLISSFCTQRGIAFNSSLEIFDEKKRPLPQFSTISSLGITNGQNLLIGFRDSSISFGTQWPLLIALGALIIGVIGILSISMVYGLTGGKYPDDFGVVMDAGSSKTNTIVYKWQSNKHKGTGCVSQEDNCYAPGGIAEMDPMKLDPVINCAKKVTNHINLAARPKTPLFFAATAGMRLLRLTNETRANEILAQLNNQLNQTGLSVQAIEIISGEDEGIYGWITANYLQQTLEIPQKINPWVPTTYGALDMGGASMQIAYALPEKDDPSVETSGLKLYGQTHNIFSHSNLCFGRDEAERRYRYLLITDPTVTEIQDPCLPQGYTYTITGANLFKRPCTNSTKFPQVFKAENKYMMERNYTFIGQSSPELCQSSVAKLLNDDICKQYRFKECFKKLDNIPDDQEYLAFATYYFTTDFLNVTHSSLEDYEQAMENFCIKNITEVQKISKSKFAVQYCFNSKYIHEVLINGFRFQNSTWKNIQFVQNIAEKDVGWTLGYMINATNLIPEKAKSPRLISAVALTVSLILFIMVVIATLVFLFHYHRKGSYDNKTLYI